MPSIRSLENSTRRGVCHLQIRGARCHQRRKKKQITNDAKITLTVPGGDWSNETIDISDECPIMVRFETITEEAA